MHPRRRNNSSQNPPLLLIPPRSTPLVVVVLLQLSPPPQPLRVLPTVSVMRLKPRAAAGVAGVVGRVRNTSCPVLTVRINDLLPPPPAPAPPAVRSPSLGSARGGVLWVCCSLLCHVRWSPQRGLDRGWGLANRRCWSVLGLPLRIRI